MPRDAHRKMSESLRCAIARELAKLTNLATSRGERREQPANHIR